MKYLKKLPILILLIASIKYQAQLISSSKPTSVFENKISNTLSEIKLDEDDNFILGASQNRQAKKANKYFQEKQYAEAIPLYEKALVGNETNKSLLSNLSECYRLTKNTDGQLKCYESLIAANSADPIHELYYGEALMENGEYDLAKSHLEKFNQDDRGKVLLSSIGKLKIYKKDADAYELTSVAYNSSEDDFCAIKFFDEIVFASTRNTNAWIKKEQGWTNGNYVNLYNVANNNSKVKSFLGDLDSKFNDGPISFTKDFNTVYFTRNNTKKSELSVEGTYKLKFMSATMDMGGFTNIERLPFVINDFNYAHPSISQDGMTLYFSSDMAGGKGGMDIYVCKKDSFGVWSEPKNLGTSVNTAGNEIFPFVSAKGTLYFSSNGRDGLGGLDIFECKILNGKPSSSYNMGEPVNSKDDDFGIFLVEDCKSGFISSNRKSGGMDDDIYELKILREVKRGKEITLAIKDKQSKLPLDSVKIIINGDTASLNEKGEYLTALEENQTYKIEVLRNDYVKMEETLSDNPSIEEFSTREMFVEKDPKIFLRALITDARTKQLLEGVNIKITDIVANSELDHATTTSSGDYFKNLYGKKVGDKITYLVRLQKPGYLQRSVIFSYSINKPGEINMNEKINLSLGKIEVGMDLAKMVDLKPIYFDFNKSNIRKDAAKELDKIIQVMKEYPNMYIELGSHTDCRSSVASNLKLSGDRAKSAVDYIVKKGIVKNRLTAKGYGESKLLNNCACEGAVKSSCPESEHDKNRRIEFLITKLK
jgi:outer membrane protein OmpA-like peptidoglycan-associated protein/tetratricopeptide (TPR) repeat protein